VEPLEAASALKKMAYQQAQIAVQKTDDYEALKSAIDRIFGSSALEKFYSRLQSKSISAREFQRIAASGIFEQVDATLARSGKTAKELYESLTVSDQALMREYYLELIEKVDPKLRQKYSKVYRYNY